LVCEENDSHKTSLTSHFIFFLLKCLYQARKVSGRAFVGFPFCLFLRFFPIRFWSGSNSLALEITPSPPSNSIPTIHMCSFCFVSLKDSFHWKLFLCQVNVWIRPMTCFTFQYPPSRFNVYWWYFIAFATELFFFVIHVCAAYSAHRIKLLTDWNILKHKKD